MFLSHMLVGRVSEKQEAIDFLFLFLFFFSFFSFSLSFSFFFFLLHSE